MWELDYKKSWVPENWCFWTVVLGETLESPLDCREIKSVYPKGNQSWIFIERTDVEAETPILWPPDEKNWFFGKHPDAGKEWRQKEKAMTEDKMVGWRHQLKGHKSEQALGIRDVQGSLECCSPWGHKELDMTERLNGTELNHVAHLLNFPRFKVNSLRIKCKVFSITLKPSLLWPFPVILGSFSSRFPSRTLFSVFFSFLSYGLHVSCFPWYLECSFSSSPHLIFQVVFLKMTFLIIALTQAHTWASRVVQW